MKIAIEAQRIFRKEKHGMDYVALETIRELQKIDQQNEYFILVSPGDDVCLQESANMHIVTVNWPSYPLWEQIGLPLALKKIKPDLLHCTSNTAPVYGNIPLVLTLHDIIFLEKKQGKNQSIYTKDWDVSTEKSLFPKSLPNAKESLPFLILNATASVISCTLTNNCLSPYTTAIHNISYPYGTHKPSLPDT